MLTPRQALIDCQGAVHPRFSKRRERRPGIRERHSAHESRSTLETVETPETPRSTFVGHVHTGGLSERCTIRPDSNRIPVQTKIAKDYVNNNEVDEAQISTHYMELTTIDNIRKQMTAQPRQRKTPPTIPDWLLNLDLNLDVTAVDIIPPFDPSKETGRETYSGRPKVTIIREGKYNGDSENDETLNRLYEDSEQNVEDYDSQDDKRTASRLTNYSTQERTQKGPRRYQGDMKVMSLQMGGIRSTPFQPKSKKFINQMITYNHMKFHNKKMKTVKPAVDAKMPSTFHIALDRKKLVEERLTESWNASYHSSTPRRTTTPSSSSSISKTSQKDKRDKSSS